ncbi:hypothetical protein [Endozoicomonas sp. 4G]|uniref:hypothetical protein n=1 Tax=Endozoicomonas sp. 4G TaxID=2872754 RepID=UPI002078A250|nr:hypothetical protein [Endozoicomonas sp. 4G]
MACRRFCWSSRQGRRKRVLVWVSFNSFHSDSQADRESPRAVGVSGDDVEGEAVICQTGCWSMQRVCTDKRLFSKGWSRITG